jgi:hypothetical protein
MASVNFSAAVTYEPFHQPFIKIALEAADDLCSWSKEKMRVIPGHEMGSSEGVVECVENPSLYKTVFKAAAYATLLIPAFAIYSRKSASQIGTSCLLALPLIALVVKFIFRSIYKFHYLQHIEVSPVRYVGELQASEDHSRTSPPQKTTATSSHKQKLLDLDRVYRLSPEKIAELRIKIKSHPLGHNLPQQSNGHYLLPPSFHTGTSDLDEYKDSKFEVQYRGGYSKTEGRSGGNYYEIVRRLKIPFLLPAGECTLSTDEVIALKIVPVSHDIEGYSILEEYRNCAFTCQYDPTTTRWSVTTPRFVREYPFLPFNRVVELTDVEDRKLLLNREEPLVVEFEPGVRWAIYETEIAEYRDSIILVRESDGGTCQHVRMPKFRE